MCIISRLYKKTYENVKIQKIAVSIKQCFIDSENVLHQNVYTQSLKPQGFSVRTVFKILLTNQKLSFI